MKETSPTVVYGLEYADDYEHQMAVGAYRMRLSVNAPKSNIVDGLQETPLPVLSDGSIVDRGLLTIAEGKSSRPTVNFNLETIGAMGDFHDQLKSSEYVKNLIGSISRHDVNGQENSRRFRILHWDNRQKNKYAMAISMPVLRTDYQIRKEVLGPMIAASMALTPRPEALVADPDRYQHSTAHGSNTFSDVAFRRGLHCDSDTNKGRVEISVSTIMPYQTSALLLSADAKNDKPKMAIFEGNDGNNAKGRIIAMVGGLALANMAPLKTTRV